MKMLVWASKYGPVFVFARDPEEEARAWLYLFQQMDAMYYYTEFDSDDELCAYKAAKGGDARGAKWLLEIRSDCEYERITIEHPVQP